MVDKRVDPSDQLFEVVTDATIGKIAPRDRQVGGDLPVEAAEPFDVFRTETCRTTSASPLQE